MAGDKSENSSWLEALPEEFGEDNENTGRRMLMAGIAVVLLAVFGGVIWYSYMSGNGSGPVPVIKADRSVIKVKPEEPGGLEVPDQDKHVYDNMAGGSEENADRLGPSAEIPLERPQDTTATDTASSETTPSDTTPSDDTAEKVAEVEKEEKLPPAPPAQIKEKAAESPAIQAARGDFLIQVGAFADRGRAETHWNRLVKKHGDVFKGLKADYMQVDLGNKGIFYRVRGGMIESQSAADEKCKILKSRKLACIVVKK